MEHYGDALIIFCSRRQMEKTPIEVWQRQCVGWLYKTVRTPEEEAERQAARAKFLADDKRRRQEEIASLQLAAMMKWNKGIESWRAGTFRCGRPLMGPLICTTCSTANRGHCRRFSNVLHPPHEDARDEGAGQREGRHRRQAGALYLGIKLAETVPLPARGAP